VTRRTRNAYDIWAATYDSDPNPHIALEHPDVLRMVAACKGQRILDAGCGTGKYALEFLKSGASVVGIDFSEAMLAVAARRCQDAEFHEADLQRRLPFPDESFDAVNCAQTLKHLPKLSRPMKEFARVLKPGGILVFSVTHPEMNWEGYAMKDRDRSRFCLTEHADIFHHRFFDYIDAVDKAGFALDSIVQVPVSARIRKYLTPESYRAVKGRFQIVIFRLRKHREIQGSEDERNGT
jgi:ubiquinone/menaquinone biosynthesis C-methylase UbiE